MKVHVHGQLSQSAVHIHELSCINYITCVSTIYGLIIDPLAPNWPDSSTERPLHWRRRDQGSSPVQAWIFQAFLSLLLKQQLRLRRSSTLNYSIIVDILSFSYALLMRVRRCHASILRWTSTLYFRSFNPLLTIPSPTIYTAVWELKEVSHRSP